MHRLILWESNPKRGWRTNKWPSVKLMFEQYGVWPIWKDMTMRTVFTIELKADIDSMDEERRRTFIDLTMGIARQLYSQSAMIAAKSPQISVTEIGSSGKVNHPLFEEVDPTKD